MIDAVQVLWSPAGMSMPSLGGRRLVDVHDGDTPSIRMPVRMLSIDTPEVTARSGAGAARVDQQFAELAQWIRDGKAPVSPAMAEYILPKLAGGKAGTLQFQQGTAAAAFATANVEQRLKRPNGTQRNLFVRTADSPFDTHGRLLAYLAPDYSATERAALPRAQRSTFNLDMVTTGWAATFVIYPSIPGELDLPLLIDAAATARTTGAGAWADELAMPGYEYRSMERLHDVTAKIVAGTDVAAAERFGWRERYCADMRDRVLHGPEGYPAVPPEYRLWLWAADVAEAVSRLNLTPAPALVTPR
jgi:endonuclease YncB( thermonuclease family)